MLPLKWETLYKTKVPEELEHAEFYQPRIEHVMVGNTPLYFVTEIHGWWEQKSGRAPNVQKTLNPIQDPDHGFTTFDEANREYEKQATHRASEGFVHSLSPTFDPVHGVLGNVYRRVPTKAEVKIMK